MSSILRQWRRRAGLRLAGANLSAAALAAHIAAPLLAAPADEEIAMQAVCGSCHTVELVAQRARSPEEWRKIFERMVELGATGTDEQFVAVGRYILARLTVVRINEASARELARLLDVSDSVAAAIVARREERGKLRDLEDLAGIPGLDIGSIPRLEDRILF